MVISKKKFLKRCYINVIIRHDWVVAVINLSLAGLLNWRSVVTEQNKKNHCIVAQ